MVRLTGPILYLRFLRLLLRLQLYKHSYGFANLLYALHFVLMLVLCHHHSFPKLHLFVELITEDFIYFFPTSTSTYVYDDHQKQKGHDIYHDCISKTLRPLRTASFLYSIQLLQLVWQWKAMEGSGRSGGGRLRDRAYAVKVEE